jgi:hypothetical protein
MDAQLTLGDELRDRGMAVATTNTPTELVTLVDVAIMVCRDRYPLFTADHVRTLVELEVGDHPRLSAVIGARMNAAGRRREIASTGMTTKSTRPEAHSRRLLVWRRA